MIKRSYFIKAVCNDVDAPYTYIQSKPSTAFAVLFFVMPVFTSGGRLFEETKVQVKYTLNARISRHSDYKILMSRFRNLPPSDKY